jgi:predicted dehydrogenase
MMKAELTAFIIGFGQSGARFARACSAVDPSLGNIRVAGIADRNPARMESIGYEGATKAGDFQSLWRNVKAPDLVIIATNDGDHHGILMKIKEARLPFGKILCEKPVVTASPQGEELRLQYPGSEIAVNYLERFSPAVLRLREHLFGNDLQIRRVDFTWSKYRVKDPRPSPIGVLSEISHALDLSLFLSAIQSGEPFEVIGGYRVTSDFARDAKPVTDELSMALAFRTGVLISGRSSYVRTTRLRRLEFLLSRRGTNEIVEIAELTLDEPAWDDDRLLVHAVGEGSPETIFDFKTASSDLPTERRHLEKLCRFIEANVAEINGNKNKSLARLDDAIYVQRIVESASLSVGQTAFSGFPKKL